MGSGEEKEEEEEELIEAPGENEGSGEEKEEEEEEELIEESDDGTDELIFAPHINDTVADTGTVYENVTVRQVTVEDNDDFEVNYDEMEEEADELVHQYEEIVQEV